MLLQPGGQATVHFSTQLSGVTQDVGVVSAIVIRNAVATSIVPVITHVLSAGVYAVSFTVPANWVGYDKAFVQFTLQVDRDQVICTKPAGVVAAAGLDDELEVNIDRLLDLMEADQVKIGDTIFYYLKGSNQTTLLHQHDIAGSTCVDDVSLISP